LEALDKGYTLVATCADCHENHKTKSTLDPDSTTFPENLPSTCGKKNCHEGVNFDAKVAAGLVHDKESLHTGKLVFNKTNMDPQMKNYFLGPFDLAYWIAIFFKILTTTVIGFFAGMVVLDFLSRLRIQRRFRICPDKNILKFRNLKKSEIVIWVKFILKGLLSINLHSIGL